MEKEIYKIIDKEKLNIVGESIENAHGLPNECYLNGPYTNIERKKIFEDNDDFVLNYFHHFESHHYDVLSPDEKIMHDIRKKMIKSKSDYDGNKKIDGDSDLVFNGKNSDI